MGNITKSGCLRSDPIIKTNGNMSYATFSFYDSTLREDGETDILFPTVVVSVVAFDRLTDFVEGSLRRGYTVIVTGQQDANKKADVVNLIAESIQLVKVPVFASRVPQPMKRSEAAALREEYKTNGGFQKQKPVFQSWEDGEILEVNNE